MPIPPHNSDSSAPIDRARLLEVTEGDAAFEKQLFQVFLNDMRQRFARLALALNSDNHTEAILECHSVKGAAGNIGALPLRLAAERCESAVRSRNLDLGRSAFDEMQAELDRVVEIAEKLGA